MAQYDSDRTRHMNFVRTEVINTDIGSEKKKIVLNNDKYGEDKILRLYKSNITQWESAVLPQKREYFSQYSNQTYGWKTTKSVSISDKCQDFASATRLTQVSIQTRTGVKRPRSEADHSLAYSAEG